MNWPVALFGVSGVLTYTGGLLWTGLYGAPHIGGLGLVLFVAGIVSLTACVALADDLPDPNKGPPEQPPQD